MFALMLPVLLLVSMLAIDVGSWFVHKRHLQMQADAAALAGGALFGQCFSPGTAATANTAIEDKATEYAGNSASIYNLQIGGGAARVTTLYNSKTFAVGGPGPDDTETEGPCQTPRLMFDVKQTEADVPYILGSLLDWASGTVSDNKVTAINARARVQLKKATIVTGSLPLAVPDVDPKHVSVTLVNEATGAALAGPFDLTPGATVGGLNTYTGSGTVTIPSAGDENGVRVGLRVGLGGQLGLCDKAAGTGGAGFTCFDYGSSSTGLVMIHGDGAGGTNAQPAARVWSSAQCSSSGSPFFSERDVASPGTTCAAAVFAVMRNGSGPVTTANTFTRSSTAVTRPMTYSAADGYWSSGYVFNVPVDGGPYPVTLNWRSAAAGRARPTPNAQRIYSASDNSGPVKVVRLSEPAGTSQSPYAVASGTHTFTFDVGIAGKLALSAPDETVLLRLTGGSRTTAVACDGPGGNQFKDAIINGCTTPYQINEAGYCPDPSPPAGPADCVDLKPGRHRRPDRVGAERSLRGLHADPLEHAGLRSRQGSAGRQADDHRLLGLRRERQDPRPGHELRRLLRHGLDRIDVREQRSAALRHQEGRHLGPLLQVRRARPVQRRQRGLPPGRRHTLYPRPRQVTVRTEVGVQMEFAQKLISTRRGSLYIAAVAALLAGVAILVYLNQYRDNVKAGGTPVTVLVARQTIPKGTPGSVVASKGYFSATTIRESQLREGAYSDPASLTGRVATREIYEGSQLTSADFSASAKSLAGTLTDSERVVSIPLDAAHGLIGEVEVGNHVDVYAGFNVIPLRADGTPQNGGQSRPMLRLIMPDIPVVAVGSDNGGIGSRATNVSLQVSDAQAAKLAFASDNGKVWLSLRPSAGAKASRPDLVTVETLLLGVPSVTVLHAVGGRR